MRIWGRKTEATTLQLEPKGTKSDWMNAGIAMGQQRTNFFFEVMYILSHKPVIISAV